jgi:Methyl-accepting chemotaxis protein (MCP) signalling domain
MAVNRLLSITILILVVLGCGSAGLLAALQTTAMADIRTAQARLSVIRSLADASGIAPPEGGPMASAAVRGLVDDDGPQPGRTLTWRDMLALSAGTAAVLLTGVGAVGLVKRRVTAAPRGECGMLDGALVPPGRPRDGAASAAGERLWALGPPVLRRSSAPAYGIDAVFAADYARLGADFHAALARLEKTLSVVTTSIGMIQADGDLPHRAGQQVARLAETSAALRAIACAAAGLARQAGPGADLPGKSKDNIGPAMSGIAASARQIGRVIGVIDDIAFQTNLLALNAGVEAARVGNVGLGFAILATEVADLARRSADAAWEVRALAGEMPSPAAGRARWQDAGPRGPAPLMDESAWRTVTLAEPDRAAA